MRLSSSASQISDHRGQGNQTDNDADQGKDSPPQEQRHTNKRQDDEHDPFFFLEKNPGQYLRSWLPVNIHKTPLESPSKNRKRKSRYISLRLFREFRPSTQKSLRDAN